MKSEKIAAALLGAALLLGSLSGCAGKTNRAGSPAETASGAAQSSASKPADGTAAAAKSYDEVLSALKSIQAAQEKQASQNQGVMIADGQTSADAVSTAGDSAAQSDASAPEDGPYCAAANTQAEGVDEGDIVKTDGTYLYLLRDQEVTILRAAGANTAEVGKVAVCDPSSDAGEYAQSMYVSGDTLVVVTQQGNGNLAIGAQTGAGAAGGDAADAPDAGSTLPGAARSSTHVKLYALGDRTAPKQTADLAQDGFYQDSRLTNGVLYLVSNYDASPSGTDDPKDYVPCVGGGDAAQPLPADSIYLLPEQDSTTYAVVSAIGVSDGKTLSAQAVLGGAGTVYMNDKNLYLASTHYETSASQPHTEKQYQVVDYTSRSTTMLQRFSLADGKAALAASGSISGYPFSQSALDEYDGHLRIAVTDDSYTYQIYTDPAYGFSNYKDGGNKSSNSLYVLDGDLKTVGTLGPFADKELISSVRFTGATAYVVTFRETDPLFAVDLSDPANPKKLSALKLTGFSNYLHPWGDGLMLGLGADADTKTGETSGMKLSMFNVSDPAKVSEVTSVALGDGWSEALYNQKAVLADPDKGLIAFPGESSYLVYTYSADGGFVKKGSFDIPVHSGTMRGVSIGDDFYVCSPDGVTAVEMSSLRQVWKQEFSFG